MRVSQTPPPEEQLLRLKAAIRAALSSPLLDDVEDFAWEAVFHYAKGLPLRDPLTEGKTKRLFDAIDAATKTGWSLKAVQCSAAALRAPGKPIEFVIQRSNIFGKAVELGFPGGLGGESQTSALGQAIVRLWNQKFDIDKKFQDVEGAKLAVLLKSKNRRRYGYFETELGQIEEGGLDWEWSVQKRPSGGERRGLQARRAGQLRLKWYRSGTQLFQCLVVPEDTVFFEVQPRRVPMNSFVDFINALS